jgi:hypothetical protein
MIETVASENSGPRGNTAGAHPWEVLSLPKYACFLQPALLEWKQTPWNVQTSTHSSNSKALTVPNDLLLSKVPTKVIKTTFVLLLAFKRSRSFRLKSLPWSITGNEILAWSKLVLSDSCDEESQTGRPIDTSQRFVPH